ncbi:MAG: S41 family peptidase [Acidobacteriota bacterium]|nr:S41 family peptidase [Acidobacteriota bacterium]
MNRIFTLLFAFLMIVGARFPARAQNQQTASPPPAEVSDAQKRQESFDIVWKTVNERFYDPSFGGVDWKKVRERYAPLVTAAQSDQEVNRLLQQMVSELHQSHFVIIPREAIPKLIAHRKGNASPGQNESDDDETLAELENDELTTPLDRIGYKLTERLSTGIGIDLRIIKGAAVITLVEPGSPADRAGLRPGFVIKSVGGRSLATVIAQFQSNPTFQSVFRGELPVILLAGLINGERQSPVNIVFLDGRNRARAVRINREKLGGEMSPAIGNLPAMYTEFVTRDLPGGIGYIRFNAFMPNLMKKVCAALRSHHDARGLILDLRGNQGGLIGMVGGLSGLLETHAVALGVMKSRAGRASVMAYPQRKPYSGPIVILIDGATQSAAEMFAGGLQESGRAIIVGEQSAGNTLPSAIVKLPTGALFQYGFADYETVSGLRLEGHGLTPDVSVALSRSSLLAGPDPQLAAALRQIRTLARGESAGSPRELIANVDADAATLRGGQAPPVKKAVTPVVTSASLPPPPAPQPAPNKVIQVGEPYKKPDMSGMPSVDEIIQRYVEAIGGRAALEKLTSRVSRGTVELQTMGLTGTAEIYEQAPDKSTLILNVDGLGTIQQTFDGTVAWLQDPLDGYIRFAPAAAARIREQSIFQRELRLKELNQGLVLLGKDKVGEREAFVLHSFSPRILEKFYFDALTGLLLRKGNIYYDDYREVDGVKLPFKVTDDSSYGFGIVVRLSEIKHNVPIDQAKFAESPDCFTKP